MAAAENTRVNSFPWLIRFLTRHPRLRRPAMRVVERKIRHFLVEESPFNHNRSKAVQDEKAVYAIAILHSVGRLVERGLISEHVLHRASETLLDRVFSGTEARLDAKAKLGFYPPGLLLVSPGKRCNLHCTDCYACSDAQSAAKLDWDTFDRILTDKERLWGSYFTVISGGEPFLWEDGGRDLLDMAAQHDSNFFLVYTNGTLITKAVAERLASLGNVTPAISVEGFEAETDGRRGRGVHKRILQAMANLREVGVPFGISVTATRHNADLIASDEFVDFYFDEQGAAYGWIFQYMPIGRKHTLDLMVSPEQRLEMWRRTQHLVRDRKVFIADFWNSGAVGNGCIAAGRAGGYFHIDWDGDATPCAFVPYTNVNIKDIYRRGGDLNDVLKCPLFARIRRWQDDYGYARPAHQTGNWLCPCPIRDHFAKLLEAARASAAKPIDEEAADALRDDDYHRGMVAYGHDYGHLTADIWNTRYVPHEHGAQRVPDRPPRDGSRTRQPA